MTQKEENETEWETNFHSSWKVALREKAAKSITGGGWRVLRQLWGRGWDFFVPSGTVEVGDTAPFQHPSSSSWIRVFHVTSLLFTNQEGGWFWLTREFDLCMKQKLTAATSKATKCHLLTPYLTNWALCLEMPLLFASQVLYWPLPSTLRQSTAHPAGLDGKAQGLTSPSLWTLFPNANSGPREASP